MEVKLPLTFLLIATIFSFNCSLGAIQDAECGATGSSCTIECNPNTILGLNGSSIDNYYVPGCILQNLDFSGTSGNETHLNLASKSLILNYLPSEMKAVDFEQIESLSFSGGLFYDYRDLAGQDFNNSQIGLPEFVGQFVNLEVLDLSNISSLGLVGSHFCLRKHWKYFNSLDLIQKILFFFATFDI